MKAKLLHIFTAFFLVGAAALSTPALAQHEGLSPNELQDPDHIDYVSNDDKPADHEVKAKLLTRDSITTHSRAAGISNARAKSADPNRAANTKEEDDDALSFNFLYYIIQKFKISDLVDEQ